MELYNPNQTPIAVRKSKFNLTLAHNAYELNNLHPEHLDAPKYDVTSTESEIPQDDFYSDEPQSMPHLSNTKNQHFQHKKPVYQSQQYQDGKNSINENKSKVR